MKLNPLFWGCLAGLVFTGCSAKKSQDSAPKAAVIVENQGKLELVSLRLCDAINQNRHLDVSTFFDMREWRTRVLRDLVSKPDYSPPVPLLEYLENNPQLEMAKLLGFGTAFLEKGLLLIPGGYPWLESTPPLEMQLHAAEGFPPTGGFLEYLGMRQDPGDGLHPVFRWTKAGEMRVFELIPSAGWRKASVEDLKFCDAVDWADDTRASELARGVMILLEKTAQSALAGRWERDLYDSPEAGFLMVPFNRGLSVIPSSSFPNLRSIAPTVKSLPIFMINAATMAERRTSRWDEKQDLPDHLKTIANEMAAAWQQASPDSPAVPLRTLHLWNAANQPEEWMELARRMAVRGITDPMVEYAIIVGLLTAGRDMEATARIGSSQAKFPDDPSLLWLRFRMEAGAGQFAQASQLWKQLVKLKSGTPVAMEWILDDPVFHHFLRSAEGQLLAATPHSRALEPDDADEVRNWVESVLQAVGSGPPDALLPFVDLPALRRGLFPADKLLQADLFKTRPGLEEKLVSDLTFITESLKPAFMHSAVMDRGRISVVIRRGRPQAPAYHGWLVDNMEWRVSAVKPYKIQGICQAGFRPSHFGRIRGATELGRPGMINFYPQASTLRSFSKEVSDSAKPVPAALIPMLWPWFESDDTENKLSPTLGDLENGYPFICWKADSAAFLETTTEEQLEKLLKPVIARTGDQAFADNARLNLHVRKGRKTEAITLTSKMFRDRTIQQSMMPAVFPLLAETRQWDLVVGLADLFLTPPEGYDPTQLKTKLSQTASKIDEAISSDSWSPLFRTDQGRALVMRLRQFMAGESQLNPAAEKKADPQR